MVNSEVIFALTAILADVIITPEDLSLIQFHARAGALDHHSQPDDRRAGVAARDCLDDAAPIEY